MQKENTMHILNVHGGLFFNKRTAEADAEKRNLEALPFAPLSPRFAVVGIAHENTFIAWTVMAKSEIPREVPA